MKHWFTAHHWSTWLVALILVVATFTRLYNIPSNLQFQGDQGRDAMVVANIFRQGNLVFIGPVTSVGNMYLGPLYYYFMLPFLWLSYPSPIGPAYAMAGLGILTVWLLYFWGQRLIGRTAALWAAGLYAVTATVINLSRFSWNPNPEPLVSLVMMVATFQAWRKDHRWWLVVVICFSILIQLHYVTLLTAGGAGLIWLASAWQQLPTWRKKPTLAWQWLWPTVAGVGLLLLSMTPLMLFDARHQWLNVRSFGKLFTEEQSFKTGDIGWPAEIAATFKETHGRSMHILFEYTIGKQRSLNTALVILVALNLLWIYKTTRDPDLRAGQLVILSYLVTGIVGLAFYEHTVFDHYIAFLFPVTFLIYGLILGRWTQSRLGQGLTAIVVIGYLAYNIPRWPLQAAGWTIADMARTSDTVYQRTKPGEKYNIVLLSESGDLDGQNYRYFLTTTDRPPVPVEQRSEVDTLFIINEDGKATDVTGLPMYEIVTFPNKTPSEVYRVENGPEITVLRR